MFHQLAEYYDLLISEKNTRAECRRLEALATTLGRSGGRSWLDVACGTGRHLEYLRRNHDVTGVDLSPSMLRVARRRLPGVRLLQGDMRTLELGRTFDVVSCLFSAIGHLRSEREVAHAFANFARHLKPGGVTIVEPWIDPSIFRSGHLHLVSRQAGPVMVARMSESSRRGARSVVRYRYLLGREGHGVRYFEDTDVGLLVPPRRLVRHMNRAGLRTRFLRDGLTPGRGLLVGQKPLG